MINEIVDVITNFATAFWQVIVTGLTTLSGAFWDPTDGGDLTFLGVIVFIGLGLMLVMFVVNFIRSLVKA